MTGSLLLVGCGNMGNALLNRWVEHAHENEAITSYAAIDPFVRGSIDYPHRNAFRAEFFPSLASYLGERPSPDIVVFAVKPQQLADVLPEYQASLGSAPLYISIAAGKDLAFYYSNLGADIRMIRAMPNLPAQVGHGFTALCATNTVSMDDKNRVAGLFNAVGHAQWLDDESHMHAATAIAGSGPAYVFLIAQALMEAGAEAGLRRSLARDMALRVLEGSAAYALDSGADLEQLRRNVTSPGGTTEAALAVLQKDNRLQKILADSVAAAVVRSQELAGE